MIKLLITSSLVLIFVWLAGIHFYWGLGGTWGADASVPTDKNNKKVIEPKLFECFVVAIGLLAFGVLVLVKSGLLLVHLPDWLSTYGVWGMAALFLVRAVGDFNYVGFFKKVKSTAFGRLDTTYYSPLCLVLGILLMALAMVS